MTDLHVTDDAGTTDRPSLHSHASREQAEPDALVKQAADLEAASLFDQADEMMRRAIARSPNDDSLFAKYTKMALQRGDWHGALERAAQMRERCPNAAAGYSDGLDALRKLNRVDEANLLLKEGTTKFVNEPWPLHNAALLAETRDDTAAAEECWNALCRRFPDNADVWAQKAGFYRRCGRLEGADDVLSKAIERFPGDFTLHIAFGQVAGERRDWEEADRRWTAARSLFPKNSFIALQHALVPVGTPVWKNKNFDEAIARLTNLTQQFPESGPIQEARIRLLRIRGRLDDAAALAAALMDQLPQQAGIGLEYARVLMLQNRNDQAIACLTDLKQRSPDSVPAYVELAAALSRAGRWDEAESICKQATTRFRSPRGSLIEYANIAVRRAAWREAFDRWQEAMRLHPADPEIRKGMATTRLALAAEIEANGGDLSLVERPQSEDQGSIADLLMKFESLGAPVWGCEFGFVQRKFGAEPISLLRWASVNTRRLIEALESRFEGVGLPEQTTLTVPVDTQIDYHTRDTRYWIELHTFVYRGDAPDEKKLLEQSCPRVRYLRRKIMEDLESGDKIFVFRPGTPALTVEELDRLYAAMRSYGDNTLFYVICGDPNHRAGTVEIVKPGLMIGFLSRLSWSPQTGVGTPDFSGWVQLCAEAHRVHTAANAGHLAAENTVAVIPSTVVARRAAVAAAPLPSPASITPPRDTLPPPAPNSSLQSGADPEALMNKASQLDANCQFDEADEVMRAAMVSFPKNGSIFAKYTKMAWQRGDWHGTVERAAEMRARFPNNPIGYSEALEALRELNRIDEASALQKEAAAKFPNEPWPLRSSATLAEAQQDVPTAEKYWQDLHERFSDRSDAWLQRVGFYRRCGRLEAADELIRKAMDRFPNEPGVHLLFSQVAFDFGDWTEAAKRYSVARELFPNNSIVALQHALLPTSMPVWKLKNFDETLARLEKVQQQFPDFAPAPAARIRMQRFRGNLDEAAALAVELINQSPEQSSTRLEYSRVLVLQGHKDQAIACLRDLIRRMPNTLEAYVELAAALSRVGRQDEAENICETAISLFRFRRGPLIEYANIAMRREDWHKAVDRWREAMRLLPADTEIRKGLASARLALAAEIETKGGDVS